MKFIWSIIPLMAVFTLVSSDTLQHDLKYDDRDASTNTVTCSAKLKSKGYNSFEDIPSYPDVCGANFISEANPAACGSCWQLTNTNSGQSIYCTIIDHAIEGFDFTASIGTIEELKADPVFVNTITAMVVGEEFCQFPSS